MKYWKSITALILLPFAFYFNLINFYFAILFLAWSIQGIQSKMAYLFDTVYEKDHPILFWTISIAWIILSLLSLLYSEPVMNYLFGINLSIH